jgi:3-(3-hydroxy-phenyl)propionate hydroxylase
VSGRDPVVVAGAGPTGLMCALALGKQGIPVILCEAEPALTVDLRAGSFHPPTLEMMAPYGITQRMHETGIPVRHWQIRDRTGEFIAEFDLGLLADVTAHPDPARYPAPGHPRGRSVFAPGHRVRAARRRRYRDGRRQW